MQIMGREACRIAAQGVSPQVQLARQLSGQFHALGVIQIQHGGLQTRPVEQLALGRPVGVHAAVIVQMILGEIGEQGHADGGAVQAMLFQADAGGLDGAGAEALLGHAAKALLQQHRVRGCQAGVFNLRGCSIARNWRLANAQGAHHAAALAQQAQGLRGPPGGGGFAIGAGAGDHAQGLGRLAVESRGDQASLAFEARQRGHAGVHKSVGLDAIVLHQAGGGAGRQGLRHELATITRIAGPGDEGITRLHGAAVGAQGAGGPLLQPAGGGFGGFEFGQHDVLRNFLQPRQSPAAWPRSAV